MVTAAVELASSLHKSGHIMSKGRRSPKFLHTPHAFITFWNLPSRSSGSATILRSAKHTEGMQQSRKCAVCDIQPCRLGCMTSVQQLMAAKATMAETLVMAPKSVTFR